MRLKMTRRTVVGGLLAAAAIRPAYAAGEDVTNLFPGPTNLPSFIPDQLALKRDYFAANKLNVSFQAVAGGAEVAKQVGVGNAQLGRGVGETSMIVRPNGLPIRAVAQLGSHSPYHVAVRQESNVKEITDLRGKTIGVNSYQDSGYYALLAILAVNNIDRSDVEIQAVGPSGIIQLTASKTLDGIMSVPEWSDAIERAGIALNYFQVGTYFPAFAPAILTSDTLIKERPEVVRGYVQAVLQAVRDCIDDPASAAKDCVSFVPREEAEIERILRRYVDDVFRTDPPTALGAFDPAQLETVQDFYLKNKIITEAVPIEDLYSNEFVQA